MRTRSSAPRPWRPIVALALAVTVVAACNAITGTDSNAYGTVKGTVVNADNTPFAGPKLAVVCTIIGRGVFGDSVATNASGGYSLDIVVPPRFMDDLRFLQWQTPCDFYAPDAAGRAPDTTRTIAFAQTQSAAPTTTVNFTSKPASP